MMPLNISVGCQAPGTKIKVGLLIMEDLPDSAYNRDRAQHLY
jgi:hypothetical protein